MTRKHAKTKRKPPVRLPLPFDTALDGLLGMSPQSAKKVNKKVAAKRKQIDGAKKKPDHQAGSR